MVASFAARFLITTGYIQIGQNELRRHFGLKPQQLDFINMVEEVNNPDNSSVILSPELRKYFQSQIHFLNNDSYFRNFLWPEEICFAEKFLDKKFPEIRQLFRLNYAEKAGDYKNSTITKDTIEQMFQVFYYTKDEITKLFSEMITESIDGVFLYEKSRCYKKVLNSSPVLL
jgi:hypothetical protein